MPYWVYILESETTGKLYTGQTSDLNARLKRHNSDIPDKTRYTRKQQGPWRLVYSEQYATRSDAMKREKVLKTGRGRERLRKAIIDSSR